MQSDAGARHGAKELAQIAALASKALDFGTVFASTLSSHKAPASEQTTPRKDRGSKPVCGD